MGAACHVCKFSFEERYGTLGKVFIHVHHHRQQLVASKGEHVVIGKFTPQRVVVAENPVSRQLLPTSRHTITHCDLSRHSSYPLEQTAIFYCRPHGTL